MLKKRGHPVYYTQPGKWVAFNDVGVSRVFVRPDMLWLWISDELVKEKQKILLVVAVSKCR